MGDRELDDPRCNVVLERLLGRAGWAPENLGDHLNRLAATLGLKVHVNRRYPRRWVYPEKDRAAPRIPRDPLPSLVCLLLRQRLGELVSPDMLGWPTARGVLYVPADDGLQHAWDAAGAIAALGEVVDADSMERRHFMAMTGLSLTAVAHQWLLDPAPVAASVLGKRVDHAVVDDLERVAEARRRLDDVLGGGSLLPATREDLRLVVALLKNSSYAEEIGRRLYAVAAEFARFAGWLAYDANRHALAQRYFIAALRASHTSGDPAIGANILGFMSYQSARIGDPRDALVLAESAIAGAQAVTPAVMASLEARRALGSAHTGDRSAFLQAQDRTFELLATSSRSEEPPWIYWFTESDAHGMAGQALLALNHPGDAADHLREAIRLIDPAFVRDRALWLSQLAAARVLGGSLEQGCATASEAAALLRKLDSTRVTEQLADFRRAAEPYAGSAAVREFDAKYRDLIHSTSA